MRLAGFIIALLLLAGTVDPTRGWLIALVVVTGLAALRPRPWNWLALSPAVDFRLAAFIFAALLLGGAIEPTRDWLIALTAVTGVAAFMPRTFALDLFGREGREHGCKSRRRAWDAEFEGWTSGTDREWDRWERRMDRRRARAPKASAHEWGDDWS